MSFPPCSVDADVNAFCLSPFSKWGREILYLMGHVFMALPLILERFV
jgi:hypothetical protein